MLKAIFSQTNQNTCHYMKWKITDDLSLRFFYTFSDRPDYQWKFFLKSHKNKQYQEISQEKIIQELQSMDKEPTEILGRQLPNGEYKKILFSFGSIVGIDTEHN